MIITGKTFPLGLTLCKMLINNCIKQPLSDINTAEFFEFIRHLGVYYWTQAHVEGENVDSA